MCRAGGERRTAALPGRGINGGVGGILACCCAWLAAASQVLAAESPPVPRFESDVRPILRAHCWQCHGEEEELQGGLDTRLVRYLLKGGDSGPALVPGDHAQSLIYQRMAAGEMPPGEKKVPAEALEVIARWIDAGAQVGEPEPESLAPGDIFTSVDRAHWSFQPVRRPEVPQVAHGELVRTPIDAFLLAELEARGLTFSPEADRATLARRLSFDLIGLPPSPEEVDAFVQDTSPDAYDRLVDRLLASEHYGERWGRHWLDVAGYADSDGYSAKDLPRKWAWRYRDYVVRSLNADKPWDRFLLEQLAGDELLTPPYRNLTPEQADCLIATGFLRMGPDGTGDPEVEPTLARNEAIAETIKIVSTALLGLTIGCAQCHAHRYDPISQVDYYRMRAIFEPAYDCQNWRTPEQRLVSIWSDEVRAAAAAIDQELEALNQQRLQELDQLVAETFERELAKLPAEIQPAARAARETPAAQRTAEQVELIKKYPFLNVDRGSVYLYLPDRLAGFNKKWDAAIAANRARRPAEDLVHCLTEVPGKVPTTRLFYRGDHQQPREEVAPGVPAILSTGGQEIPVDDPALPTTGRRLAFARHLTDGRHPLVARVIVNRIWMHHFGRGIVGTPGDFGMLGDRPSHPALLDWLADEFVRSGWQLKRLHRLIVTSTAYRQQSFRRPEGEAADPDNRLLWRYNVRRLEAEIVRDALLAVSGRLCTRQFGPPVPVAPDEVGQIVVGVDTRDSAGRPTGQSVDLGDEAFRRSLYIQVRRTMPLGLLEPFDAPIMSPNCQRRASSTVAAQSLLMMNSPFVAAQAEALAERVMAEAGTDPGAQFVRAWRLVFGRVPSPEEREAGLAFLSPESAAGAEVRGGSPVGLAGAPPQGGEGSEKPEPYAASDAERYSREARQRLIHLCHALVASNGFLYVD